jgi:hypothetical protein
METPMIVDKIKDCISERLGREAIVRKINNRDQYFILDLAFSYFQKADRNRRTDYRTGYFYFKNKDNQDCLMFVMAHSPIMTSFFKNNFDFEAFKDIIIDTSRYRDEHFLRCKIKNDYKVFKTPDLTDYLQYIDNVNKTDFIKTVLAKSTNGKTGVGNIFSLLLAKGFYAQDINDIITSSWDLFLWLYPSKPIFRRNASLNRSLQKLNRQCEIGYIKYIPPDIIGLNCVGQIEGAHIKPHKNGGSDKLENGLWLCNLHHRLTENKLEGQRDLKRIDVRYIDKHTGPNTAYAP